MQCSFLAPASSLSLIFTCFGGQHGDVTLVRFYGKKFIIHLENALSLLQNDGVISASWMPQACHVGLVRLSHTYIYWRNTVRRITQGWYSSSSIHMHAGRSDQSHVACLRHSRSRDNERTWNWERNVDIICECDVPKQNLLIFVV